jgi:hypothetical protein
MMSDAEERHEKPVTLDIPVSYLRDEFLGSGTAVAASPRGLLIQGDYTPVTGTRLRLMLSLPGGERLYIKSAVVRFRSRTQFGIELLDMSEETLAQFNSFLAGVMPERNCSCSLVDFPWEHASIALGNELPREGQEDRR